MKGLGSVVTGLGVFWRYGKELPAGLAGTLSASIYVRMYV